MMFKQGDEEDEGKMRQFMGPMMVDHYIRQAISHCWMIMPKEKLIDYRVRRVSSAGVGRTGCG